MTDSSLGANGATCPSVTEQGLMRSVVAPAKSRLPRTTALEVDGEQSHAAARVADARRD
jgi:hypothetical protein